jgi:phospholipid/cholesterol/gamma-HCH transport system ATP-binding protein
VDIGEKIIYLSGGNKMWEGDKESIVKANVSELNSFLDSSSLMKKWRT